MPDQPRYADDWEYALAALRPDGQGWEVDPDRPASRPGETCWRRPLIAGPAPMAHCPVELCPWDSRGTVAGAGEPRCAPTFTFGALSGCLLASRAAEARTVRAETAFAGHGHETECTGAHEVIAGETYCVVAMDQRRAAALNAAQTRVADALSAVAFAQDHSTTRLTTEQIVRIALGTLDPPEPGDFAPVIARIRRDHKLEPVELVACEQSSDCEHAAAGDECPTGTYIACAWCEEASIENDDPVHTGTCDPLLAAKYLERLAAAGIPDTREDIEARLVELMPHRLRDYGAPTQPAIDEWFKETAKQPVADVTHAAPPSGSAIMPCCKRTPFEVPALHRMTTDSDKVTCPGRIPMNVVEVETALRWQSALVTQAAGQPWLADLLRRAADLLHQLDRDRARATRRLHQSEWKRRRLIDYLRTRNSPAIIALRSGLETWRDRCRQAEEKALALASAATGLDGHAQWAAGERERADLRHQVEQLTERLAISSANNRTQRTKRQDVQRQARRTQAQLVAVRDWITQHKCCSNPQACGGACMDDRGTYGRAAVARELDDLLEAIT